MACKCDHHKVLLIEVTGLKHDTAQDFAMYDLTDMTQQSALEGTKYTDKELAETTIYGWDWCKEKANRNVWLTVKAGNGPIQLPLFENVTATERRVKKPQDYQLQAFIPLTLLPTFKQHATDEDRLAPVRSGYLYIAYHGKIWREIEVSATDAGAPCFKDINLYAYREGRDQPLKKTETRREVTGEALKAIWYPARDNGSPTDIRMAFSEVQWSGSRINYLEANPSELAKRMEKITDQPWVIRAEDRWPEKALPEMRSREMAVEMLLGEPALFSRDLSGNWLAETYQQTKSEIESARKDGAVAISQYHNRMVNPQDEHRYNLMFRQTALSEIIATETKQTVNVPNWEMDSVNDYLADAKARFLRGVVLRDPLFEFRHLSYLIKSGVSELGLLLKDASIQPYFKSAELVQRFFVPRKWGKTENPYHDYLDTFSFDGSPGGRFRRTIRLTERMLCFTHVKTLQKQLATALKDKSLAMVLKDITSLDGVSAAAVYPLVGNAVSALSLQIGAIDTLGYGEADHDRKNPHLAQLQQLLGNDRSHPLHELLFTENGQIPLDGEYTPPEGQNDGSGLCTPAGIARWADENLLVKPEKLEVFELANLFPQDASENGETSFIANRRIAGAVDGLLRDYFIAVTEVMRGLSHSATAAVNFETVYVPLLSALKSAGPSAMGKIELTDINQVKQNYLVIGVEGQGLRMGLTDADREFLSKRQGRNAFNRVYDVDGRLVLSTNKKMAQAALTEGAEALHGKGALKVVVVPENDPLGQIYSKPATQRTLKDMATGKSLAELYEKLRVPHFMVAIEVMNLWANKEHFKNVWKRQGLIYSGANALSAVMDISVALTHSANMLLGMESQFAKATEKTLFKLSGAGAKIARDLGFQTVYSRLVAVSTAAGLLTAGIAIYDAFQLWGNNDDDAAAAMMAAGIGLTMATLAGIAAEGSFLSALGPWGIAIGILGGFLYMVLKDSPLETWLKNGPFATSPGSGYAHLQDPEIAFQRLLGLLLRFDVTMYDIRTQVRLSPQMLDEWQSAGVTHLLWVRSNLTRLLSQSQQDSLLFVRQALMEHKSHLVDTPNRTGYVRSHQLIDIDQRDSQPLKIESTADGQLYGYRFNKTIPKDRRDRGLFYTKRDLYHYEAGWMVRAQFVINGVTFPMPPLDDPRESPVPGHGQSPTFKPGDDQDKDWQHYQLPPIKEEA